jgi:hypothetical protein
MRQLPVKQAPEVMGRVVIGNRHGFEREAEVGSYEEPMFTDHVNSTDGNRSDLD